MFGQAEYIWLDGTAPVQALRSKTRILHDLGDQPQLTQFPQWSFDGSSTNQSPGNNSDLLLNPVCVVKDPIRGPGNFLVMCEVMNEDGTPHASNQRAKLRAVLDKGAADLDAWFGFEQEYVINDGKRPVDWPENGFPSPQGPFYCGVGAEVIYGRPLVEAHTKACLEAGLLIYGTNAEVMPSQWEFQIGYRGAKDEKADALTTTDHSWLARWLLFRLGEEFGWTPNFECKPVKGDWNGSGQHTNFSTRDTRDPSKGSGTIETYVSRFEKKHKEHIAVYGVGLEERLTGQHETCSIYQFKAGTADRGCSIRIPRQVAMLGYGYFEDRRPGANADPYAIATRILATVIGVD